MSGIYVHIPFCESRCVYCGFYSTTQLQLQDNYVDALIKELELRKNYLPSDDNNRRVIDTIYLGGGTPSLLSPKNLEKIFTNIYKVYNIDEDNLAQSSISAPTEITMECNPEDVTLDFVNNIKFLPINRISMGIQTFSDERLRFLNRRHDVNQVFKAIDNLRHIGINNISIDLMFGFPRETIDDWMFDIRQALNINVQHISAYSLMYEEGTKLYSQLKAHRLHEIDDELSNRMYDSLIDELTAAGYEHYEISNFALSDFRSRHNSSYWNGTPYLGIGAAAHSYNRLSRQWNISNITKYINSIDNGKVPMQIEMLDDNVRYDDTVTTALRTSEGIYLKRLKPIYYDFILENSKNYIKNGLLSIKDGHLILTRKGIHISDYIMSDLMFI